MNRAFSLRTVLLAAALFTLTSHTATAQVPLAAPDTPVTIDFAGFDGTGFSATPANGQLDSDHWRFEGFDDGNTAFGETLDSGDYARGISTGGVTSGGIYAFETALGTTCLGVQPTGNDFTPGEFVLRLSNTSGVAYTALRVTYDLAVYNDGPRSTTVGLATSSDDVTYTSLGGTTFTSDAAAQTQPAWSTTTVDATFVAPVAVGGNVYLAWESADLSGTGTRDEFAICRVVVEALTLTAFCGDNVVDSGETCDDGLANSDTIPDACRTNCTLAGCGDDVLDTGETCDDGAANSDTVADACRTTCLPAACGDDAVDSGEECDDGAANSDTVADACRADCTLAACGDNVVDSGETCDDGNLVDDDGCSAVCAVEPRCGDDVVDSGEECDDGAANSDTNPDACRTDCTLAACGDNVIDTGEECDDGSTLDGDGCDADCALEPVCGDGTVDTGETCDDGAANSDTAADACRTTCVPAACGDNVIDTGEVCDDGNTLDGDDCNATCTVRGICGDGVVNTGEACDDGNNVSGDGCTAACTLESDPGQDPGCGCQATGAGDLGGGLLVLCLTLLGFVRRRRR